MENICKTVQQFQNYGNGSNSAVLIIKDVRCEDVGQYQCSIAYGPGHPEPMETHTYVYVQGTKSIPYLYVEINIALNNFIYTYKVKRSNTFYPIN